MGRLGGVQPSLDGFASLDPVESSAGAAPPVGRSGHPHNMIRFADRHGRITEVTRLCDHFSDLRGNMGRYTLDHVMLHEIPRGRPQHQTGQLVLTNAVTAINAATHDFLCDDLLERSIGRGRHIVEAPYENEPGQVPRLARELFADPTLLPEHSRTMAARLYDVQAAGSSPGIFMAALGRQGGSKRLILMKAEHQHGMRLNRTDTVQGVEFSAEHIKELIVGNSTKVYKIAVLEHDVTADSVRGLMVDMQADHYAAFFLDDFLQCVNAQSSEVLTRDFVQAIDRYVRTSTLDMEQRARIVADAAIYLDRTDDTIQPSEFITNHIPVDQRDAFEAALPAALQGSVEFRRDPGLVGSQLGGVRMSFGPDITLITSAAAFENESVVISTDDDGQTRIVIRPPDGDDGKVKLSRPKR